jgi:hypothetical protein
MEEFIKSLFGHVAVAGAAASAFATLTGILTGFYTDRLAKARLHKTKDIIEEATEHLPRAISYRVRLNPATGEREIFDATGGKRDRRKAGQAESGTDGVTPVPSVKGYSVCLSFPCHFFDRCILLCAELCLGGNHSRSPTIAGWTLLGAGAGLARGRDDRFRTPLSACKVSFR